MCLRYGKHSKKLNKFQPGEMWEKTLNTGIELSIVSSILIKP